MDRLQFEPMTVGQILDKTFRLWRANFLRYLALVAVVLVPLYIIQLLWQMAMYESVSAGRSQGMALVILTTVVLVILRVVGENLGRAALMKSVSESYLGREATVGQAYRAMLPRLGSVIWASVMVGLIVGVVMIVILLMHIPRQAGVDDWLQRQSERLARERHFGG